MGKKSRAAPAILGKRKREPVVDINPAIADPQAVADPRNHRRNAVKIRRAPAAESTQPEPPLGKAASRKKRRLDSYVDKKLRQERKVELLAELACVACLTPQLTAQRIATQVWFGGTGPAYDGIAGLGATVDGSGAA